MTRKTISYKEVTLIETSNPYGDNLERTEEKDFDLELHDKEIRADERRKFAEWLVDTLDCNKTFMNAYIKKYEKEVE